MDNKKLASLVNNGLNIKQARNIEKNLSKLCAEVVEDINKMTHLSKEDTKR